MRTCNVALATTVVGFSLFVGVGCATPRPIVRLTPLAANVVWVAGRAAVVQESANVRVAAGFERQDGDNHSLHIELENRGEEAFEVGPEDVWFARCSGTTGSSCGPSHGIINPERVLADLDIRQSRERAAAINEQAMDATLLILSAATDIAQVASGHANPSTGAVTASIATAMDANDARHETATMNIAAQREMWANVAFRRTTLPPGRGVAGNIFFRADLNKEFVVLRVRARQETFEFWFRQTVIPVLPPEVASARAPS